MEADRSSVAKGMRQEDAIQHVKDVETGLEASVFPPLIEPNVIPSESEQPLSSSIVPSADAAERPQ